MTFILTTDWTNNWMPLTYCSSTERPNWRVGTIFCFWRVLPCKAIKIQRKIKIPNPFYGQIIRTFLPFDSVTKFNVEIISSWQISLVDKGSWNNWNGLFRIDFKKLFLISLDISDVDTVCAWGDKRPLPPKSKYFTEIFSQSHIKLTYDNPNKDFKSV